MKKKFILTALALFAAVNLAACANTVHGAGQDIENAGHTVQEAVPPKR